MSEKIYVNTGSTFQQAFNDRSPRSAQQPYIANAQTPYIANSQTPFTYSNRQPAKYQNPTSAQQPYIANAQQPYPYIANARQPYIASAQQPYPYIASAQNPYIANARQPAKYQSPSSYQIPYIANSQTPYPANARQPSNAQTPYIANSQTPYPANARQPVNAQQPSNAQAPYPANAQTSAYYRNPFTYNANTPASSQTPVTYDVWGGGNAQATSQLETTTDVSAPMAPFSVGFNYTSVGQPASINWGPGSTHIATSPNSAYVGTNALSHMWNTQQQNTFSYSFGQCFCQFFMGYESSSSKVYYGFSSGNSQFPSTGKGQSPNRIYLPLTELSNNNIIDSSWSISVKYTVQSQSITQGGTDSQNPANPNYGSGVAAGTYVNLWNGSTVQSGGYEEFMWSAVSSSNPGNSDARVQASGVVFTVKAHKTGQTSYYTHYIVAQHGAGSGGPFGEIFCRSVFGNNHAPV
tara:strand:- start:9928 stop:11319 length:1392 start_codon:yes stop_codon:yes gene_type:complete